MKVNTKCRYGTRAVLEIAKHSGSTPIKRKQIVESQDITDSYLENILVGLKKAGIIETIRGPKGGYALKKSPSKITILDIFTALGGDLYPADCVSDHPSCPRIKICQTRTVWKKLKEVQENILGSITIKNLLGDNTEML